VNSFLSIIVINNVSLFPVTHTHTHKHCCATANFDTHYEFYTNWDDLCKDYRNYSLNYNVR